MNIDQENKNSQRQSFLEDLSYDVNPHKVQRTQLDVVDINRWNREKRINYEDLNEKRYYSKKLNRKKIHKKMIKKTLPYLMSILAVFGSVEAYNEYKDSKNILTLEQALDNGETIDTLGLDETLVAQIENLTQMLDKNITNSELIAISKKVPQLQKYLLETKLANQIDGLDKDDIITHGYQYTSVEMYGPYLSICEKRCKTSSNISHFIKNIYDNYNKEDKMNYKSFNRDNSIKYYKKVINEISKFAAGKITMNKRGKIKLNTVRVSELEKKQGELGQKDEGIEPADY